MERKCMDFIDINKENNKTILLIHPISFIADGVKDLVINNMPTDYLLYYF